MIYRLGAAALAAALLFAALANAQTGLGSAVQRTPAAIEPQIPFALSGPAPRSITLPEVDPVQLARFRQEQQESARPGAPYKVGFSRSVESRQAPFDGSTAAWTRVPGGFATQIEIRSPGAQGLRAGIAFTGPRAGVTLRFAGSAQPNSIYDLAGIDATERDMTWGPLVEGDTLVLEVFVAEGLLPQSVRFAIPQVMHLDTFPADAEPRNNSHIGRAGACNRDIKCQPNPSPGFSAIASSTAKISFVTKDGESLCSGTLVNNRTYVSNEPPKRYFITAAHCISSQAVANTMTSFWFFEAPSCGARLSRSFTALTRGADLVFVGWNADHTLLRIREAVPSGITYAGWEAGPIPLTSVLGIHHPKGDLKKYSQGRKFTDGRDGFGRLFHGVQWTTGVTEPGSSGSGLFILDSRSNDYRLVGQLSSGESSCVTPLGADYYGRFQDVYSAVSVVLDPPAPALTVVNAASFKAGSVAPSQLVSAFGGALPSTEFTAPAGCRTELGGRYSVNVEYTHPEGLVNVKACVSYIGPSQVNFVMPDAPLGTTSASVTAFDSAQNRSIGQMAYLSIATVSPGIFTRNGSGTGVPSGSVIRVSENGETKQEPMPASPADALDISDDKQTIFLVLYGTGIRNRAALQDVAVTVAGIPATVEYAGPQGEFAGLDQLNIRLPLRGLRDAGVRGRAIVELTVAAEGAGVVSANPVDLYLQ